MKLIGFLLSLGISTSFGVIPNHGETDASSEAVEGYLEYLESHGQEELIPRESIEVAKQGTYSTAGGIQRRAIVRGSLALASESVTPTQAFIFQVLTKLGISTDDEVRVVDELHYFNP